MVTCIGYYSQQILPFHFALGEGVLSYIGYLSNRPHVSMGYNTIQYNTIRVYCGDTLSYNNGVPSHTEPKSGSVKARQLIYRYSTNTIKLKVKS